MSEVQEMQEQFSAEDRDVRAAFSLPACSLVAQEKVGRTPQAGEGFRVVWRACISIESLKTQSRRL